ncbi:hypothetical protein [Butyrivibrio sp.]|uniref:hypothetical protein n=1 Tax=Butyrivibrio sp. TaxID=28121 RepID=UPI0025C546AB|nr:hypothetical protein [Butyrivibrio sp.]MBQ9303106.1 hypothetical protein [Butyrivibrio sp.]
MSRMCPETGEKVVYLTCQECDDRFSCLSKSKQQIAKELHSVKTTVKPVLSGYCNNTHGKPVGAVRTPTKG